MPTRVTKRRKPRLVPTSSIEVVDSSSAPDTVIRIIVADAQPVFRYGVRELLHAQRDCRLVGEAADANQAVALARALEPDVMLVDFSLPGGAKQVLACVRGEPTRLVVLGSGMAANDVARMTKLGARGIIAKDAAPEMIVKCVRAVCGGEVWLGRRIIADLIREMGAPIPAKVTSGLTPRERQVVELVATGEANRGIAQALSVSEDTVKHHLSNIFDKTGVSSRLALALFAQRHDLIKTA